MIVKGRLGLIQISVCPSCTQGVVDHNILFNRIVEPLGTHSRAAPIRV